MIEPTTPPQQEPEEESVLAFWERLAAAPHASPETLRYLEMARQGYGEDDAA